MSWLSQPQIRHRKLHRLPYEVNFNQSSVQIAISDLIAQPYGHARQFNSPVEPLVDVGRFRLSQGSV